MAERMISILLVGAGGRPYWKMDLPSIPGATWHESMPPGFEVTGVAEIAVMTSPDSTGVDSLLWKEITRLREELNELRKGRKDGEN